MAKKVREKIMKKKMILRVVAILMVALTLIVFGQYAKYDSAFPFHIFLPFLFVLAIGVAIFRRVGPQDKCEEGAYLISMNVAYLLTLLVRYKKNFDPSASMTAISLALFSLLSMMFHFYEIRIGGYVGSFLLRGFIVSLVISALMWIFSEEYKSRSASNENSMENEDDDEDEERESRPSPRGGFN